MKGCREGGSRSLDTGTETKRRTNQKRVEKREKVSFWGREKGGGRKREGGRGNVNEPSATAPLGRNKEDQTSVAFLGCMMTMGEEEKSRGE